MSPAIPAPRSNINRGLAVGEAGAAKVRLDESAARNTHLAPHRKRLQNSFFPIMQGACAYFQM